MEEKLKIAILGLGEAGSAFANDLVKMNVVVFGFDPDLKRTIDDRVILCESNRAAVTNADIICSVNLSSASCDVAEEVKSALHHKQFYCEMNTSGPDKKIRIGSILKDSGVQYIDLAIMAPVPQKGIMTPMLASGTSVESFFEKIKSLHLNLTIMPNSMVGDAATDKLLRSIVYKGIAAVVSEAMEAGAAFGKEEYVKKQINSLILGGDEMIDRFVEGSKTHAVRRKEEMEAVIDMIESKNINPIITRGTKDYLHKLINP